MAMSPQQWSKDRPALLKIWCDPKYFDLTVSEKLQIFGIRYNDVHYKDYVGRIEAKTFQDEVNMRKSIGQKAFAALERNLESDNPSPDLIKSAIYYAYGVSIAPPAKAQIEASVKQMSFNVTNIRNITSLSDAELERLASPGMGLLEAPEEEEE